MRAHHVALLGCTLVALACGDSGGGGPSGTGGNAGGQGGMGGAGGGTGPTGAVVWNSWKAEIQAGPPQATIAAEGSGPSAELKFFEAVDDASLGMPLAFEIYDPNPHMEDFNKVERTWTNNLAEPYPYVGKSTVGRGMDTGEMGAPEPMGVMDLGVHPPEMGNLTVIAFVAPAAGTYTVSGVAGRRISGMGGTATLKVFGPQMQALGMATLAENGAWASIPNTLMAGTLAKGDMIYFGLDKAGRFDYDACRIAFTVTSAP